jgi:hypothetical protein
MKESIDVAKMARIPGRILASLNVEGGKCDHGI